MRLSIVVITYNRKELLRRCLHSLLNQDYPKDDLQIIVSDDGSTDGTREMVEDLSRSYPYLVYTHQPHRGIPAARNNGLRMISGDVVAFVADDYILRQDYASTAVSFLQSNPEVMVVRFKVVADNDHFGGRLSHLVYEVNISGKLNSQPRSSLLSHRLSFYFNKLTETRNEITVNHDLEPSGGAVFRREVFETAGLFDESLARAEDTEMKLRLKKHRIPIHYYPFHEIKHHYHFLPFDTLRKCYLSGLNRASLHIKHTPNNNYAPIIRNALTQKLKGLLVAFWRARQSDCTGQFFLYFPFILVFEAADKIGYTMGIVRHLLLRSQIADGPL